MSKPVFDSGVRFWSRGIVACVLLAAACLAPCSLRADAMPRADQEQLFARASQLFREATEIATTDRAASEAKFREAAGAWREIARSGNIHNVQLETNIANASLLAGDPAQAIVAYRRALAIDPANADVRAGLAAARRAAGTEALATGQNPGSGAGSANAASQSATGGLRGTLSQIGTVAGAASERVVNAVSPRTLLIVAVVCYAACFGALVARLTAFRRIPRAFPIACAIIAAVAATPLVLSEIRRARITEAVVVRPNVVARNGPADLYDPAFQEPIRAGLEVTLLERRAPWAKIKLRDGRSAWVREDALEPI